MLLFQSCFLASLMEKDISGPPGRCKYIFLRWNVGFTAVRPCFPKSRSNDTTAGSSQKVFFFIFIFSLSPRNSAGQTTRQVLGSLCFAALFTAREHVNTALSGAKESIKALLFAVDCGRRRRPRCETIVVAPPTITNAWEKVLPFFNTSWDSLSELL